MRKPLLFYVAKGDRRAFQAERLAAIGQMGAGNFPITPTYDAGTRPTTVVTAARLPAHVPRG